MRWTLPNVITLARICLTPVIALLPFISGYWPKVIAFLVFLIAAFSDLVDGYLARRYGTISELGMMLDPVLLARDKVDYAIRWWGSLPVWAAILLVGREVLITIFRFFAKRRGIVIPAIGAGKLKAVVQNVFIGATIAWFAWKDAIVQMHLVGDFRNFWDQFHGWFVAVTLAGAIVLTIYSLLVYLYRYRTLLKVFGK